MPVLLVQTGMEQSGAADVFFAAEAVRVNLQAAERCQLKSRSTVRLKSLAPFMQSSILHLDYLRRVYEPSFLYEKVAVVDIATRPDCVGEDVVSLLCEYSKRKPVWVELGLQTIHEDTAAYIRRGYDLTCFENALKRLNDAQIPVIVHVILGLPGEDKEKMLETIRYLNNAGIFGIKLQLLHVLENTDLADEFRAGKFQTLSMEAYVDLVVSCIGALSPDIVIHRLTGDGPSNQLISPLWSRAKRSVLNCIHHELKTRGIYQGCFLKEQG